MLNGLNSQLLISFSMQLLSKKFLYQNSVFTLHFSPLCDTSSQVYNLTLVLRLFTHSLSTSIRKQRYINVNSYDSIHKY